METDECGACLNVPKDGVRLVHLEDEDGEYDEYLCGRCEQRMYKLLEMLGKLRRRYK